jgi:outer membrane protein insertion porin family
MRTLFLFFLIFFLNNSLFAEIKQVKILGNKRVSSSTIESLIDKKTLNIDSIYINNLTRKIYNTDFFSDIKITYEQDILTVTVTENPIVNFFYINGLSGNDLDKVNKIVSLKENTIFSSSKLKKDIEEVKQYFKSEGYYSAIIDPEVIKLENNDVNLILNFDLKNKSRISNIYFIGDKYFSQSQLADVISSSEYSWWKLFSSGTLSEERIEYDKKLLKDFYKLRGFYDIQIESVYAKVVNNEEFTLTYSVNSGKRFKFGNVDIKTFSQVYNNEDILEIKKISDKLTKDEYYSSFVLSKLNKSIVSYLDSKKYYNFDINLEEVKSSGEVIDVIVQLIQEKKIPINKINISGNTITNEKFIRDNMVLSEGDNLSNAKIRKSVDIIKSKQIFSKVEYKIDESNNKNGKELNLFVKEQPTGSISAGIGYGSNGAMFEGSLNEKNFLGNGVNLNFTGRISSEKITGDLTYVDPNFNNSEKEMAYSLFSEKDDYSNSGYSSKKVGNKISTKYDIYEDIAFRPSFAIQYDKLETDSLASNLLKSRSGNYITTSLGYAFYGDFRDSKFNPSAGYTFYFDQNLATLISDIPTIQTSVGSIFYKELINDKFIGSAKIKLSNVTALDNKDAKLSDRLYASSLDLRGFESRGVGPVDNGDHIGGNNLAILSVKSTFPNPIPESLKANTFIFYDVGNVWGVDYSDIISSNSKFRSSIGVAMDFVSPVGPLSFAYSIPISKSSTDKEQRFLFNIGSSF